MNRDQNPIYDQVDTAPQAATIEEVREHASMLKEVIATSEKAERLAKNPDFKDLILDFYMQKEPARLVSFLASGEISEQQRDVVTAELRAIGHLKNTLSRIVQMGASAQIDLEQAQHAIATFDEFGPDED